MTADYRYPITNSDGTFSNTIEDFDDVFVPQDMFLNANLLTWGTNNNGELGQGNTTNRSSPIQVGTLTNWKQVSLGGDASACVKTDGTLWTWGVGTFGGRLGLNDEIDRSSPVQVGTLTNWKQVSFGTNSSACVKTDGTLWLWGDNQYGQLGLSDTTNRSSPVQVGSLTNWKQVSCSGSGTGCIKTDGTLWTWGDNTGYGKLGLGDTTSRSSPVQVGSLTNWKQIDFSGDTALCIKTDGTLWAWGLNNNGQLGLGDRTYRSSPVQVGSLTDWKQVSCIGNSTACIKIDGTLWTWGLNSDGKLGLADTIDKSSPVQVGSLTNWKQVTAKGIITACVKTDGTLWVWGTPGAFKGALGLGDTISRSSPVQVGVLTNWKQVSIGTFHTACVKSNDLPV